MTTMLKAVIFSCCVGSLLCLVECIPLHVNQISGVDATTSVTPGGLAPQPCTNGCGYIWRNGHDTFSLEYANHTDNVTTTTTRTTTTTATAAETAAAAATTTAITSVHSSDLFPAQGSQVTPSSLETSQELVSSLERQRQTSSLLSSTTDQGGGLGQAVSTERNRQFTSTHITTLRSKDDVSVSTSPRSGSDFREETTQPEATLNLAKPESHVEPGRPEDGMGQLRAAQDSIKMTESTLTSEVTQLTDDVVIDALFTNIDFIQDELEVCEEWLRQKLMLLTGPSVQDLPTVGENNEDDAVVGNRGADAGVGTASVAAAADDDDDDDDDDDHDQKQRGDEDIREVNDYDDDNEETIAIIRDIQSGHPSRLQTKDNDSQASSVSSNNSGPIAPTTSDEVSGIYETNRTPPVSTPAPASFHHSDPVDHHHSPSKESKNVTETKQPRAENSGSSPSWSQRIVLRLSHRLEYLKTSLLDCYDLYKDAN